jgi:EAL domain-containing protein (putative c-di-GMP-specific phosphodiesterase class I)
MSVKQRILIVDDDRDIGELVIATAEAMGFQCTATTDAMAFQEKLTADTTLVVLDLMLPEMDGVELLRMLSKRNCKAGIVLISAAGRRIIESTRQLAQLLGLSVVGHLQKPFQLDDLRRVLQILPMPAGASGVLPSPQLAIQREELQSAIERDEFVVYYQPQIEIASGCVIGVEGLARWRHPTRGLILPDRFVTRMERFGLIDELGWMVANRGMSEVKQFATGNEKPLTLSLNASVYSLRDLKYPDILLSIARKHCILPQNVTIEITETGLIKELSRTLDILTRLRLNEVEVSIDDFGTGYAMMQQIKTIPATELKIDKSFVQEMVSNDQNRIMIKKTIEMGHELGMQVTAEGVETEEQFDFLRATGCDSAQGYLFSGPIPAGEMMSWLKTYHNRLLHSRAHGLAVNFSDLPDTVIRRG